eukprot:6156793-Pleurochrysis_carterae.AAC.1
MAHAIRLWLTRSVYGSLDPSMSHSILTSRLPFLSSIAHRSHHLVLFFLESDALYADSLWPSSRPSATPVSALPFQMHQAVLLPRLHVSSSPSTLLFMRSLCSFLPRLDPPFPRCLSDGIQKRSHQVRWGQKRAAADGEE